jgi:hypothetical protein
MPAQPGFPLDSPSLAAATEAALEGAMEKTPT